MKSDNNIITIGERRVGAGQPCFVIAEAGVNHNGDLKLAFELVDIAVQASADAVKFQTFLAEKVCSPNSPQADYQLQNTGIPESQLEMVKKLELPFEAFRELQAYCRTKGIIFLSTPFDHDSIDFLAALDVPAFKIPSGEVTNAPFVEHVAQQKRPVILSTGMATLAEVAAAVETLKRSGNQELILLQCVSNYPAKASNANLRAMATMAEQFQVPVGFSDHTTGIEVAIAAVALGACAVEKHFTISKSLPGPDHAASLDPKELAELVRDIRNVEGALGDGIKRPVAEEANTAAVARRSLVAARDIKAGTILTEDLIEIMRPGTGLAPGMRRQLVGRRVCCYIEAGALLTMDMMA